MHIKVYGLDDEFERKINNPEFVEKYGKNINTEAIFQTALPILSVYSTYIYGDVRSKTCFLFTPRSGCSTAFQAYLDYLGLLHDALEVDNFIHRYRYNIFNKYISNKSINDLVKENYTFVKFIINPYIRAVGSFLWQKSCILSFREYMKSLINNTTNLTGDELFHIYPQYCEGEEEFVNHYIRVNENETYTIKQKDGNNFIIDPNKYKSVHHSIRHQENTTFSGDIDRLTVADNLPASYKYFYDNEIKELVETYYKVDFDHYSFTFNF